VRFAYLNLAEDPFPSILNNTVHLDMIICRNVFIYFSLPVVRMIMEKFSACLLPGGTLMIGASDPFESNIDGLVLNQNSKAMHFLRRGPVTKVLPVKSTADITDGHEKVDLSLFQAPAQLHIPPEAPSPELPAASKPASEVIPTDKVEPKSEDNDATGLEAKARELADLGDLEGAEAICRNLIEQDSLAVNAHFLLALIHTEQTEHDQAEAAIKRVLFLDRQIPEAHFQLGMLKIRTGQRKIGLKSLEQALELAKLENPDLEMRHSDGTTYGRFVEVLEGEINIYKDGQA
jgi:chemotaxis protein methyltransferase CheR